MSRIFKHEIPKRFGFLPAVQQKWSPLELVLEGHCSMCVAFSPRNDKIVSSSADNLLRFWNAISGQFEFTLEGHLNVVSSVAFSPKGDRVVSGSFDNTVRIWDVISKQLDFTLEGHSAEVKKCFILIKQRQDCFRVRRRDDKDLECHQRATSIYTERPFFRCCECVIFTKRGQDYFRLLGRNCENLGCQ